MNVRDFRRIALSFEGAEEGSHVGSPDFRVGERIFATLPAQHLCYGNVKLTPEQQAAFVEEMPDVFLGMGPDGMTHVRLAAASVDLLRGALQAAWKLPVDTNAKTRHRSAKSSKRKPDRTN